MIDEDILGVMVWDHGTEEADVRFDEDFESRHYVFQLDALNDLIYELTQKYNALLSSDEE